MSSKVLSLEGIGDVSISKRRGQRTIRLSVSGGVVKVSQPSWLPYSAGETFLRSKLEWVREHHKPKNLYRSDKLIGKSHVLALRYADKRSQKIKDGTIVVSLAFGESELSTNAQSYINKVVLKALRNEAENFLPERTHLLADTYGFSFKSVSVKQLKRRWGSCNSTKEITFNLHLMELEYTQIDYVILHELCHTKHMNHGAEFWQLMEQVFPDSKKVAKTVRKLQV